ncbi:MAG: HAMP domain-containing histidine kinase [Solobacterium sp.]|nr:HAMP domain-containing histidine kinase [Solobacterium sp.]
MKKTNSLKFKIALYLITFSLALIALTFLFQTVLLKPMYENSKIEEVKTVSTNVINELKAEDKMNWSEIVYDNSVENDLCLRVFQEDVDIVSGNVGCVLYRLNEFDILREVSNAKNNNNSYLHREERVFSNRHDKGLIELTYTQLADINGEQTVVLVNTSMTPVNSTVSTLKQQLWYFSLIALAGVFVLVYLLNKQIAQPIKTINEAAKDLAQGEYNIKSDTSKYREVEELNQTLSQAAIDIKKADQAKRDLIANVSHDLRTPLTMINGYGEMMRDLPGEKTDENCQVIIDESKRLTYLVNDLLDLSKMQSKQIALELTDFSLSDLVQHELRKYDVYRLQEGFEFVLDIEEGVEVHADEKRIAQVFNNYMTNAINYSTDEKYVEVRLKKQGKVARCEVVDHGEGIEKEKLKDIWDRYYKIDREHIRFVTGSGIGLSIVKEIMDLHKTNYGVESEVGKGSTFYFELPLAKKESV